MKHLIDPTDLSVQEISEIIALAEDIIANREKYSEVCRGKKLATLFPCAVSVRRPHAADGASGHALIKG